MHCVCTMGQHHDALSHIVAAPICEILVITGNGVGVRRRDAIFCVSIYASVKDFTIVGNVEAQCIASVQWCTGALGDLKTLETRRRNILRLYI